MQRKMLDWQSQQWIFVCLAWRMLHVMKDSSVMPSIFDEAMKWLVDNIKGTPWEASWNAFGISRNGKNTQTWWTCSEKCLIDRVSSEYLFAWLDACFMWWRTQVSCHPFSMRPWNGSLTISRGHPEKPVEMRLVLAEMAEICKNSEHAAENAWLTGSAVEEIFVCLAWCMLHVMKDSSVMPSIFDEAMKWLVDNIKGTPWEASWNAFGISRNGRNMQK